MHAYKKPKTQNNDERHKPLKQTTKYTRKINPAKYHQTHGNWLTLQNNQAPNKKHFPEKWKIKRTP